MTPDAIPRTGGLYVLLLRLDDNARLHAGRLGSFELEPGWYAYAGSAHGAGGLRGRIGHHLRPLTTPHWHIDALRSLAPVRALWWAEAPAACEHALATALGTLPEAAPAVPRFGASDCRCQTHLFFFAHCPHPSPVLLSACAPGAAWHTLQLEPNEGAAPGLDAAPAPSFCQTPAAG